MPHNLPQPDVDQQPAWPETGVVVAASRVANEVIRVRSTTGDAITPQLVLRAEDVDDRSGLTRTTRLELTCTGACESWAIVSQASAGLADAPDRRGRVGPRPGSGGASRVTIGRCFLCMKVETIMNATGP